MKMKTLEDALSVAGQIEAGKYRLPGAFGSGSVVYLSGGAGQHGNEVEIRGTLLTSELRLIADHLDPQPDSSPVIPEGWLPIAKHSKNTYEPFLGRTKLGAHFVFRWDGEKFISIPTGMFVLPDEFISLKAIGVGRIEAAVRAEARREALEEAAKVCDAREKRCLAEKAKAVIDEAKFAGHYASKISADSAAAIRALIEKEPADG